MELNKELPKRQRTPLLYFHLACDPGNRGRQPDPSKVDDHRAEHFELPSLDVNMEHIDVIVPVRRHQAPERPHLRLVRGPVRVDRAQPEPREVRAALECAGNAVAEAPGGEVVSVHFAVRRSLQQLALKRRVPVEP